MRELRTGFAPVDPQYPPLQRAGLPGGTERDPQDPQLEVKGGLAPSLEVGLAGKDRGGRTGRCGKPGRQGQGGGPDARSWTGHTAFAARRATRAALVASYRSRVML